MLRSTLTTDDVINVNAVSTTDSVMSKSEQLGKIRDDSMTELADVFAIDGGIHPMMGREMQIHLQEGAIPFQVRKARPLPLAWRDIFKAELDDMVLKGIIMPMGSEPSDWCQPFLVSPKPQGGMRMCTYHHMLNHNVKRSVYPLITPAHPGFQKVHDLL